MDNKIYSGSSAAADETLRRSHHLSEQLADITAKVLRFTNAGGAAIAIGAADVAVTKATSGDLAPDLETPIRLEGSFAGLCIREGELLYCEDAENDSRVDAATSAAMGLRSMVMVPIGERGNVRGVLAAFSGVPGAFRPTHIAVLRTLADIVHELIVREEQTRAAAPITQSMRRYEAPAPTPEPAFPRPEVPSSAMNVATPISRPEPVEQSPKVIEIPRPIHQAYTPAVEAPVAVPAPPKLEATVAPVIEPVRAVEPPKAPEPAKPIEVHVPVEPPKAVDLPKKDKESLPSIISLTNQAKRSEGESAAPDANVLPAAADPLTKPQVSSASATAAKPAREVKAKQMPPEAPAAVAKPLSAPSADSGMFRGLEHSTSETNPALKYGAIAVLGLVVLAGAIWGVRSMTRSSARPAAAVAQDSASATQPVSQPPAEAQPSAATSPAQKTSVNTAATTSGEKTQSKPETKSEAKASSAETKTSTPDAKTVIIASKGGQVPARPQGGDLAAPQVALNSGGTGIGALLTSKSAPTPTLNVKRSILSPPDVIKRVPPKFPEFARRSNPAGDRVVLNVTVGKDGHVGNVQVVRGQPLFAEAAINAVKQWQYRPAFLNGEAVEATVEVVISFTR